MLLQEANRLREGLVGQAGLLVVADRLRLLRERVVVGAHRPRGGRIRHPVVEDHRAGELGRLLEVVGGAVRDPPEHDLLGRAAGEVDLEQVLELLGRVQVALLARQVERVPERAAARDDRDLVDREQIAGQVRHDRVAGLVVGDDAPLLLGHDLALLEPCDDPFHRVLEVGLEQLLLAVAAGEDRGLVGDVLELRAGQAGRLARDRHEVDVLPERLAARVDAENRLAAREVRRGDEHLAVEAARPEQGGIEVLEPVGRAHHDHLLTRLEAVQLDEQLVQRLVLLAREPVAGALRADRVELVDEDDRGRVLARLFEQLPDSRCAEAGEHLDERRRALGEELRARLAGDRLREQRLAGAGWPVEQDPLRDARAQPAEALGVAQEVDHLVQLPLGLVEAGDVVPRDFRAGGDRLRGGHLRHHLEGAPEDVDHQDQHHREEQRQPVRELVAEDDQPIHPLSL